MIWVKCGGGTGTGSYGKGLAPATLAHNHPEKPPRPAHPARSTGPAAVQVPAAERPAPTAYTTTQWTEVLDNRVMLELLAQCLTNGEEPEMSIYYQDALATFGAESVH